ncbi:MAG: efflux RND transporter periplasmic adaptor subunit [Bacteroidota bacterium]
MKRLKIVFAVVIVFAITLAVLFNNKSRMQARSKNDEIRFLPVTLLEVSKRALTEEISLTGTIAAYNDVAVVAETQGRIVNVFANVGDRVAAGSVLIQLDDELKKAAYTSAEVNYEKAKKDLERYETVYKDGSVSDAQLEGARMAFKSAEAQYITARRQYNDTKIKTPISGVVTSRPYDLGTWIQNNSAIANVVDISRLKVKLNVAERDVFRLNAGDVAGITTDVYPGVTFKGKISTISSKADDAHTYAVEVSLTNNDEHPLKVGMFARVTVSPKQESLSLAIPRQTLVGSLKQPQVFVVNKGIARLRDVVVGNEVGEYLKILSGLNPGEQIVSSGQNNLKDSVAVTVVK